MKSKQGAEPCFFIALDYFPEGILWKVRLWESFIQFWGPFVHFSNRFVQILYTFVHFLRSFVQLDNIWKSMPVIMRNRLVDLTSKKKETGPAD